MNGKDVGNAPIGSTNCGVSVIVGRWCEMSAQLQDGTRPSGPARKAGRLQPTSSDIQWETFSREPTALKAGRQLPNGRKRIAHCPFLWLTRVVTQAVNDMVWNVCNRFCSVYCLPVSALIVMYCI